MQKSSYTHFSGEFQSVQKTAIERARRARRQRITTASIILVVIVCFLLSAIK